MSTNDLTTMNPAQRDLLCPTSARIKVRFAPAATFGVQVRTGLSARPTNHARIIQLYHPPTKEKSRE